MPLSVAVIRSEGVNKSTVVTNCIVLLDVCSRAIPSGRFSLGRS